jgi:hypothetical protein
VCPLVRAFVSWGVRSGLVPGYQDSELFSARIFSSMFDLNFTASGDHVITIGGS